jgi:muramoyltetrapeptide carboxypeptidase
MGFSDLTALLNAVAVRSAVVTFHGPVGAHGSSWSGTARSYLETALFTDQAFSLQGAGRPVVPGRARGRLLGGNLALIAALTGTPYALPTDGTILFLEETEEPPYRIDRMLTQLDLAGELAAARGILVGQCTKCTARPPAPSAMQVIEERLKSVARPAAMGAPIGHIPTQWVLPIGVEAELNATNGTLTLLEAACGPPRR